MTMRIRISDIVFVDLRHTPKSLVDKAAKTARERHKGVMVRCVLVDHLAEKGVDASPDYHIEISTSLVPTTRWKERVGNAMASVRDAKQTVVGELSRLREFVEIVKDVYGLDPIEGGD